MDTSVLEKYAAFARTTFIEGVQSRLYRLGLSPENLLPAEENSIDGRLFTEEEKALRRKFMTCAELLGKGDYQAGYGMFSERAASTWFNRLVALRYMEVNDFLPSHGRILSAPDGSFAPQCLKEADALDLPGLAERASKLMDAHDDEGLLHAVIVAQCKDFAEMGVLPELFGRAGIDGGDALPEDLLEAVLPQGLLRAEGPVARMVTDLPDGVWRDSETGEGNVEVLGWLYQFYIAERKNEVFDGFKHGKKAGPAELGPATQLFTPDWIVDYMVQNILGRLWMLSEPGSHLVDKMPYYIAPEGDTEGLPRVSSPEEITLCDPACGSGHILVAAFRLLAEMYLERGYRASDIPALILEKNLRGLEVDSRAAQFAELQLAMVARSYDRRFFRRGVRPVVRVLNPVVIDAAELPAGCALARDRKLLDALAHLNQCGSLLAPTQKQIDELREARDACPNSLDGGRLRGNLEEAIASCEALAAKFDCVVANPPYMGSSNFDKWTSAWVKENYPDSKSDLCTCFIERCMSFAGPDGYSATVTSFAWMFLSSFGRLREKILNQTSILSLLHTAGPNKHPDVFDANAVMVLGKRGVTDEKGVYVKLDKLGLDVKESMLREAIQNPDCGWFYRTDASTFKDIPGSPITYWASEAVRRAFKEGKCVGDFAAAVVKGVYTGANDVFLRYWFEVDAHSCSWHIYTKGGNFRRWYGNVEHVINWKNDGAELRLFPGSGLGSSRFFGTTTVTWTKISSSVPCFRVNGPEIFFDDVSPAFVFEKKTKTCYLILAFMNSSVARAYLELLSPTVSFQCGDIRKVPLVSSHNMFDEIVELAKNCINISIKDYVLKECCKDFIGHSLL